MSDTLSKQDLKTLRGSLSGILAGSRNLTVLAEKVVTFYGMIAAGVRPPKPPPPPEPSDVARISKALRAEASKLTSIADALDSVGAGSRQPPRG